MKLKALIIGFCFGFLIFLSIEIYKWQNFKDSTSNVLEEEITVYKKDTITDQSTHNQQTESPIW